MYIISSMCVIIYFSYVLNYLLGHYVLAKRFADLISLRRVLRFSSQCLPQKLVVNNKLYRFTGNAKLLIIYSLLCVKRQSS